MKFGGIEDSHVRKARAHFHAVRTLRELVSKENINFVRIRAVNSKKIEKNQKNMKFGGIADSHVRKARAHFHAVWHSGSSCQRKT